MILVLVEVEKNIKNAVVSGNSRKDDKVVLTEWKKEFETLVMRLADLRVSL